MLLPFLLLAALEIYLRLAGYGYNTNFFKKIKIGNEEYFVQNDDFSFRFFPRETARNPGVLRMRADKPAGTFRIFILGESAAMGDPEPAYGAGRCLEMLLREKFPDVKFEIINVAFTAINSHVIVPIARECARHDGDLWIIYMGNNEMVGPFGASTIFGKRAAPWPYVRLVTALQRTRTGQWFTELARQYHHGAQLASWGGMQMFLNNQISPDSPLKEIVYRNFQKNLDDIVRAGLGSGAKILLNTVAVNLKDCPPFASLTNINLSSAGRVQFEQFYSAAQRAQAESNLTVAAQLYESAGRLDDHCAGLQWNWGQCLLAQNNPAGAREHLQLACDDDALPFRADSRINAMIRSESKKTGGDNLVLFDAATILAAQTPEKMCGREIFFEHVHFDFDGSYQLGSEWARQIEKMLPPTILRNDSNWISQAACEQLLGLSDWNRALILESMAARMQVPPFSGQPDNSQRMERLQVRARQLHARMDQPDAAAAVENFRKQLARSPDDFQLRENFALFLQDSGDLTQSLAEWRRVHDLIPHDFLPYLRLGEMLSRQGQGNEAEADLRMALKIRPSLTEGWIELGNLLVSQGKPAEALADYSAAWQQNPQNTQTAFRIGKVHAMLNQHAEAVEFYRQAIKLNPANWEPHYELGGELDSAGQLEEAKNEFAAAARLNPDNSRVHYNYGVLLAKQDRLDEAQQEFTEANRLEPGYQNAKDALLKIQQLKKLAPKN